MSSPDERIEAGHKRERFVSVDVSEFDLSEHDVPQPVVQSLDDFADTDEPGGTALVGTDDDTFIGENSDVMTYGDGGAGKTTLMIDGALHLAAGDPWLGFTVGRPLRVLLIENEGPRPLFRQKLRRRRNAWTGSPLGDRVHVLEEPWGAFTYAHPGWRRFLASWVSELELDAVICGPLVSAGMETAGTLQDVRAFLDLVADVRRLAERRFANLLVHHENKGGKVSGAWEGAGDTLLHVSAQGRGQVRLHVQKARWAPETHGRTLQLRWSDGESFEVVDEPELTDDDLAEQIVDAIAKKPGTAWGSVEKALKGARDSHLREIRDGLLADGTIVNAKTVKGELVEALDHVEEAKTAHLYLALDPALNELRPDPAAVGPQSAALWGDGATDATAACGPPLRAAGSRAAVHPPAESGVEDDREVTGEA